LTLIFQTGDHFDDDKLYSFVSENGEFYKIRFDELAEMVIVLMHNEDKRAVKYNYSPENKHKFQGGGKSFIIS